MKAVYRIHRSRRGQTLIGLVIVICIILGLTYYFAAGHRGSAGEDEPGVYQSALNDAQGTACNSYYGQIKMAISQYRSDNGGANPPSLQVLGHYGVVADMIKPPCNFGYDPATGALYPPGQSPPAPAAASNPAAGNDGIPTTPNYSNNNQAPQNSNDRPGTTYIPPMAGTVGIHVPSGDQSGRYNTGD